MRGALGAAALTGASLAAYAQFPPLKFSEQTGEALYRGICQGCHMPDARGAVGASAAYPALAHDPRLVAAAYPVSVVLNGRLSMPAFAGALTDEQVADVVNYVRTHFGNTYGDTVSAADVARLRQPPPKPAQPAAERR